MWSASGGASRRACGARGGRGRGRGWRGSSPVGRFDDIEVKGLCLKRVGSSPSVGYGALGVGWSEQHGISLQEPALVEQKLKSIQTRDFTSNKRIVLIMTKVRIHQVPHTARHPVMLVIAPTLSLSRPYCSQPYLVLYQPSPRQPRRTSGRTSTARIPHRAPP